MKLFFNSFGCKVNISEDSFYISSLLQQGFELSEDIMSSDVAIVNTCGVTELAKSKCLDYIKKLKSENSNLKVAAIGCLAERYALELKAAGADITISNGSKHDITKLILSLISGKAISGEETSDTGAFAFGMPLSKSSIKTRAFLKVQDGCDAFCSYCIIPYLRGKPKSLGIDECEEAFKRILALGYKEIVLVGIHLGLYGREYGYSLADLLERLTLIEGDFRIRLSSIEVNEIDDRLIEILASSNKICHHLHIPLQSGSDRILKLMNRKYNSSKFLETVTRLRSRLPKLTIGCDIIAGFPTETEDDFRASVSLLKECDINFYHAFSFSAHSGTVAYKLEGKVPQRVKKERASLLRSEGAKALAKLYNSLIGEKARVLVEKRAKGHADNYVLIYLDKQMSQNTFCNVMISEIKDNKLYGRVILGE